MAQIKIKRGLSSHLPNSAAAGEPLFATDTGKLYVGTGSGLKLINSNTISYANTSEKANALKNIDTRDQNSTPKYYYGYHKSSVMAEFKKTSAIGLSAKDTYSGLLTYVKWSDASGGYPVQLAFNKIGLFYRVGTSATTWTLWKSISMKDDFKTLSIDAGTF